MQTKQQIQRLLASANAKPNRRLGQNFLIDLNLMRLLVDSADTQKDDVVLEVGCGTGSLTEAIAERCGCCIAVEIDNALAQIAANRLAGKPNVQIIHADILESKHRLSRQVKEALEDARNKFQPPGPLAAGRLILLANLPYNVASPVMLNLITGPVKADAMYVTIQKEVAERMIAKPGSKHYGILSILLTATGDVKTIRILKPSVFWPHPKVDSAMIAYSQSRQKCRQIKDLTLLAEVTSIFMQHRRKMLKTTTKLATGELSQIRNWPRIFTESHIAPNSRPDQLTPEKYVLLANLCREQLTP